MIDCLIRVYQTEICASVRIYADKIEATGEYLKLYHEKEYIGMINFNGPEDCHHISIGDVR